MKLAILGDGLAACLASEFFKSYKPVMFTNKDHDPDVLKDHKAVMRLRDPRVGMILGVPTRKIHVKKGIWDNGESRNWASIRDNNRYSIKTSGFIGSKSILDLADTERYLLEGSIRPSCQVVQGKIIEIKNKIIYGKPTPFEFDFCISTLPMWLNLGLAEDQPLHLTQNIPLFHTQPITIVHARADADTTDAHQTIYYPQSDLPLYRATLQDGIIIAELCELIIPIKKDYLYDLENTLAVSFGVGVEKILPKDRFVQTNGKLIPIGDDQRKTLIYHLTNKHNIFSLGRYAIWKSIRADHLIRDLEVIHGLMKSKGNYDIAKRQGGVKDES